MWQDRGKVFGKYWLTGFWQTLRCHRCTDSVNEGEAVQAGKHCALHDETKLECVGGVLYFGDVISNNSKNLAGGRGGRVFCKQQV
jgi:hypothetical protein